MAQKKISLPEIVSRDEWLEERKELLKAEKELTRKRDKLNAKRRRLPMVEIKKDYEFEGPDGNVGLIDLFEGRRQLIVYHFMWLWKDGEARDDKHCPSCSAGADEISDGLLEHLHARDTSLAYVSRGPFEMIKDYKEEKGWIFPFYSSYGSDFNFDFHVSFDETITPFSYNYLTKAELKQRGIPVDKWDQPFDLHGHSCFLRDLPAPQPKPNQFCVYVLKCSDGSFYKGQTDNFPKRLLEHKTKQVSWTASRLPVEPIHWEIFATREEAVKREKELKTGFGRKWLRREYAKGNLAEATRQAGGDNIFHTYSTYGRGAEQLGGSYYWLDLTALGRQEEWEEPKDRVLFQRDATPGFEE